MSRIATAAAEALAARAAEEAARSRDGRISAARTAIAVVLGDAVDATTLEVVDSEQPVVLTDGVVCLAAASDGVHLVVLEDEQWRRLAGPLADLAELGAALADH